MEPASDGKAPPGWYACEGTPPDRLRYWDGEQWTEHTAPAGPSVPEVARSQTSQGFRVPAWLRAHRKAAAVVGVVAALLVATGLGIVAVTNNVGEAHGSGGAQVEVRDDPPLSPEERCIQVVMSVLAQVPDALAQGYSGGVDPGPLEVQYGTQGRVFAAFVQGQALLIGKVMSSGSPDKALAEVKPAVEDICYDRDGRFRDQDDAGLSGL
jgi:uncharacterized protein DUF2510